MLSNSSPPAHSLRTTEDTLKRSPHHPFSPRKPSSDDPAQGWTSTSISITLLQHPWPKSPQTFDASGKVTSREAQDQAFSWSATAHFSF